VILDPTVAEAVSVIHFERYSGDPSHLSVVGTSYQGAFVDPAVADMARNGDGCRVQFGYFLILKNHGCSSEGDFLFANRKITGSYSWYCQDGYTTTRDSYAVTGTQID
jgi:hypothetical protein